MKHNIVPPLAAPADVRLRIVYNCFKPLEAEPHALVWRPDATLVDYLEGLPTDAEWAITLNGRYVTIAEDAARFLKPDDNLTVVLIPQGSGGFKSILRIALQAAAIALAFTGLPTWAIVAINIGVGLVNSFLLTPKVKTKDNSDTSQSYGIDGAKNSSTENIPVPVGYGLFRTAGNFTDVYTENVGDDQYLYLRCLINDGEIDSITDVELNEQPIDNFSDVEWTYTKGALDEAVNPWFQNSIEAQNKNQQVTTDWLVHSTVSEVDKARFDYTWQGGLVSINKKKGTYKAASVSFQHQYRPQGGSDSDWQNLPSTDQVKHTYDTGTTTATVAVIDGALVIDAIANMTGATAYKVEMSPSGANTWTAVSAATVSQADATDSFLLGLAASTGQAITGLKQYHYNTPVNNGSYDVRVTNGSLVAYYTPGTGSSTFSVTDNRTTAIRRSFTSGQLPRGLYDFRTRRTTAVSTDQYLIDDVYLTDVNEIQVGQIALRGRATLSVKVKLSDQLNAIPAVTCLAKLSLVNIYDESGNVVSTEWSDNPAWHTADMMCGEQRGVGIDPARVDWPVIVDWAEWCNANKVAFNGVFTDLATFADCLAEVMTIGRAAPIRLGTKISVSIDRPDVPRQVFNSANIIADTFKVTYLPVSNRANEYEVSYYDKNDRNKQRTIRYVDPVALANNDPSRSVQIDLRGCDNFDQANGHLWRQLYANRLLIRTVSFDAPVESLGISLGDIVLVQHDVVDWAVSGRLLAGSTVGSLNMDRPMEALDAGAAYSALVVHSALQRGTGTISSIVGSRIFLTADATVLANKITHISTSSAEVGVYSITAGTPYAVVVCDDVPTGFRVGESVELWDTDVVEEVSVSSIDVDAVGNGVVHLASALSMAPAQYSLFAVGKSSQLIKPYRLQGIQGEGIEARTLTMIEYNEAVYSAPELDLPTPVTPISGKSVSAVTGLIASYERLSDATRNILNVHLVWHAKTTINYAGADIYMALNGADYRYIGTALNVQEFNCTLSPGDFAYFKVIAFNALAYRAPANEAPIVYISLNTTRLAVDPPAEGSWSAAAETLQVEGSGSTPAIRVTGKSDNSDASSVLVEIQDANVDGATWIGGASLAPDATACDVTSGAPKGVYYVGVSYMVGATQGERLILGPVTLADSTVTWGSVSDPVGTKPADGATVGAPAGTKVSDRNAEDVVAGIDLNAQDILQQGLRGDGMQVLLDARTLINGETVGTVIKSVQQQGVDNAAAFASNFDLLGAKNGDNNSWVLNLDTVVDSAGQSLAEHFSSIEASNGSTTATLNILAQAYVNTDGTAKSFYTLETSVAGPNGLPVISGFSNSANSDGSSNFNILASNFSIVDDSTGTPWTPFSYANGVVKMHSVEVDLLKINTAVVPVRSAATSSIAGTHTGGSGTVPTRVSKMSMTIQLSSDGWIEVSSSLRQSFSGSLTGVPWSACLRVDGADLPESLAGGEVPGDSVVMMGSVYKPAGTYVIEIMWNAHTSISLLSRAMFGKGFNATL